VFPSQEPLDAFADLGGLLAIATQRNITPRFEFGFGLSYTTFEYGGLKTYVLKETDGAYGPLERAWDAGEATPAGGVGGSAAAWLHQPAYSVEFELANAGPVYGGEVRHSLDGFDSRSLTKERLGVADRAGVRQLPRVVGRAAGGPPWVHARRAPAGREEDGGGHAEPVLAQRVGRAGAGVEAAGGPDRGECRSELEGCEAGGGGAGAGACVDGADVSRCAEVQRW
jgi:hypothetical protein